MSKKAKQARKRESRLTAKIARLLADGGVECPESVETLGALRRNPPGREGSRRPSLVPLGLRTSAGPGTGRGLRTEDPRETRTVRLCRGRTQFQVQGGG